MGHACLYNLLVGRGVHVKCARYKHFLDLVFFPSSGFGLLDSKEALLREFSELIGRAKDRVFKGEGEITPILESER